MNLQAIKRHKGNSNACYWVKEADLEALHTVWFQLYGILEKAKLWRQQKSTGFQGLGEAGRDEQVEHRIFRAMKPLCDTVIVGPCHYTFVQSRDRTTPRVVVMCHRRSTDCSKGTIWWGMLEMGWSCVCGGRGLWEIFCTVPSTFLWMQNCSKNESLLIIKNNAINMSLLKCLAIRKLLKALVTGYN